MGEENFKELKKQTVTGAMWNFLSSILTKLASMIVQLVLARLLTPEQFGTVALLNVFITISQIVITRGFATAIIQKNDLTEVDKSSAHYMSIGIASVIYIVLFFAAPFVAAFYNKPELTAVLRVYSVVLVIGSTRSVCNSLIQKELRFKVTMWCGVIMVVVQGTVGIILAYFGFGVWALVFSYIAGHLTSAIYTRLAIKWKPLRQFSWKSVKGMFKFSSNVLISSLLTEAYSDIRALLIGKVYTTEALAFYDRANLIRGYVFDTALGAISTVSLPALSKVNDDVAKVKQGLRRIYRSNMFISTPMRIGMILVAEPLVLFLLSDKWAESIPFLQLICFTNLLAPHLGRTNAYMAMGRSDLALRAQMFNRSIMLISILATIHISVYMVVFSALIGTVVSFVTGLFANKKYLNYSIREQLEDTLPSMLLSVLMGIPVYLISLINLPSLVVLVLQALVGVSVYIMLSVLFKYETFYYLLSIFKGMLSRGKGKQKENA